MTLDTCIHVTYAASKSDLKPVTHALGWDLRADVRKGVCDVCYGTLELSSYMFVVVIARYAVKECNIRLHCRHPARLILISATQSSA
jgi:hypothetical protein